MRLIFRIYVEAEHIRDVSLACLDKYDQCTITTPQKQENEGNRVRSKSIMADTGER